MTIILSKRLTWCPAWCQTGPSGQTSAT